MCCAWKASFWQKKQLVDPKTLESCLNSKGFSLYVKKSFWCLNLMRRPEPFFSGA